MLLWRVALDGDPFQLLGKFEGRSTRIRRDKRNEAVAKLKENDQLVQHVCRSLALSEQITRAQLDMLCEVVRVTLVKDSSRRELDIRRLIRLLSKDHWYESREPVPPARIPLDLDAHFLDMEKWYHEFANVAPIVHTLIAHGFRESIDGFDDEDAQLAEEHKISASYQLAFCYANGIGVDFDPEKCLQSLAFAANSGFKKAHEAHSKIAEAFELPAIPFTNPFSSTHEPANLSFSIESFPTGDNRGVVKAPVAAQSETTFLEAAERCQYAALADMLKKHGKPSSSEDGVTPLHFASFWEVGKAKELIPQLVQAGADINAVAKRGPTIGGTPLMWSVYGNCIEHSLVLIENGADPLVSLDDGDNALLVAARSHCVSHLRMLLVRVRPLDIQDRFYELIEAALAGVSRFTRVVRNGKRWQQSAEKTIRLLRDCYVLYTEADDFVPVLIPCLENCVKSPYARMNTDIQMSAIKTNQIFPSLLQDLLREAVLNYDKQLFESLLDYGVPIDGTFQHQKTLLHLCARVPDHSIAAHSFAARLVALGAAIDLPDAQGLTPWMDAVLQRKWDLADLLSAAGASPLATDTEGYTAMGRCILAANVGSMKYLFRYSAHCALFTSSASGFLVNPTTGLSILQLAASLPLPRAHGMKLEVIGVLLNVLGSFKFGEEELKYRSSALDEDASALDIAARRGNLYAVKNLVKKGAHRGGGNMGRAVECARKALERIEAGEGKEGKGEAEAGMERKNLERCIFVIEKWDGDTAGVRRRADDWTNMRTIDESHVQLSWEMVFVDGKKEGRRKGTF
ncbi:MAG: hypothetical protein Q9195_001383 [Heterodermia aff. obscurata]